MVARLRQLNARLLPLVLLGCGSSGSGTPSTDAAVDQLPAMNDATVDGADASQPVDPTRIPAFQRPFAPTADFQTANFFDHDIPKEFVDTNGRYVSFWGEDSVVGTDGHNGYDWRMGIGTPVLSAMAGTVTFAGASAPFDCPLLGKTVSDQNVVMVEHLLPGGVRVRTQYVHLDTIAVVVGDQVQQGQQIGTVGATGCALNPHLHFSVFRLTETASGQPVVIDPYGWSGNYADPWETNPDGAQSIFLWKDGEAPPLFRRVDVPLNAEPGGNLFIAITQVRFQGVDDAHNPNNEYVEVTRDNRFAPASLDLTNFTLKNKAGDVFTFPAGFTLTTTRTSVRVFTGSGQTSDTELYWGQPAGKLDNKAECVQFFNAAAVIRNRVGWGGGCQ